MNHFTSKNDSDEVGDFISWWMGNSILFLESSSHSEFFLIHDCIMVSFCIDPSNSFKWQSIGNHIGLVSVFSSFLDSKIVIGSYLIRFVDGLNNDPDTSLVVRIFSIISIQISNSLLSSMFLLNPVLYKVLNLADVHKLNVVNMSVFLSFDNNVWWNALVTHGLRVGFVIFAFLINFISDLRWWKTVVAFYIVGMDSFAFQFFLLKEIVKWNVSCVRDEFLIKAMNAFCIGSVSTKPLHLLSFVFWIDSCTIKASSSWPMVAFSFWFFGFIILTFLFFLLLTRKTVKAFSSWWMIAFRRNSLLPILRAKNT